MHFRFFDKGDHLIQYAYRFHIKDMVNLTPKQLQLLANFFLQQVPRVNTGLKVTLIFTVITCMSTALLLFSSAIALAVEMNTPRQHEGDRASDECPHIASLVLLLSGALCGYITLISGFVLLSIGCQKRNLLHRYNHCIELIQLKG